MVSGRPSRRINPAAKPTERFAGIDGLRGLACLAVVAHHAYYSAGQYQWPLGLPKLLSYGYLGVEIFFVLSGFCLAYPMLDRDPASVDWWLYTKRRVRRILPGYWAVLLLLLVASWVIAHFRIEPFFSDRVLIVPTVRQFFYVATLIAVWFNPVFWTLTVEARWYFVLPLSVAFVRRRGVTVLLVLTILISGAYALVEPTLPGRLQCLLGPLPLFMPLFASGTAVAAVFRRRGGTIHRRWVILNRLAFACSLVLIGYFTPAHPENAFRYSRIVPGGLLATTLLVAALCDPAVKHFLSSKLLTIIGLVSYSLYLIHLPVIQFTWSLTRHLPFAEWQQCLLYQGVVVPACVCLSYAFYVAFERPFLALARSRRTAVARLHPEEATKLQIERPTEA
jgi:peptidoglycan/LPS O-acetylase OafA/YrhL